MTIDEIVNNQAKISGELETGDLLITEGNRDLQDEEKIEITNN